MANAQPTELTVKELEEKVKRLEKELSSAYQTIDYQNYTISALAKGIARVLTRLGLSPEVPRDQKFDDIIIRELNNREKTS